MCGIALLFRSGRADLAPGALARLTDAVSHRGPDGRGELFLRVNGAITSVAEHEDWKLALGHRRLSIIDLSDAGLQPMAYRDRAIAIYNGEIYNYVELRAELIARGHTFESTSDTEVMLAAYDEWGTACFRRFRGMWGLAIVDLIRKKAVLSRDRLGIKPIYVASRNGLTAVVSEIKQLATLGPGWLRSDDDTILRYLLTGHEDPTRSFFAGVDPIPAGTYVELDLESGAITAPISYWNPETVQPTITDKREAAARFREVLAHSVAIHMRSDVKVGCALSGGLDSASIAMLVPEDASNLHTFSATFPGHPLDERAYIDAVVSARGATPHFVTPTAEQFEADFDRFLWHHDEPVGSMSQYAGFRVAETTRKAGVPVTLNGQGGDEVLHGYWQGYFVFLHRLFRSARLPQLADHLLGSLASNGNPEVLRQVPIMMRRYLARRNPGRILAAKKALDGGVSRALDFGRMSPNEWRVFEIRHLYLPRLLKWDDRNFMAFSVESRYPFLDHEVIETCLSFAHDTLYERGWSKAPLRRGLEDLLPVAIQQRRTKLGFEAPNDRWLREHLRLAVSGMLAGDSPVWDYVERSSAREAAEHRWDRVDHDHMQAVLRLFFVDRWMRLYHLETTRC